MAGSIFSQLASFFFLLAAVFADIIIIRFVLIIGSIFLLINGIMGLPRWPNTSNLPIVAIDVIVWSGLTLVLNLYAFTCLVLDEHVNKRFPQDESESLYQFFYRRSGIHRKDFLTILNEAQWTKVEETGARIPSETSFHLVVEGIVHVRVEGLQRRSEKGYLPSENTFTSTLRSGNMFQMRHANIFKIPIGFLNTGFEARAGCNEVLLCSWSLDSLERFAKGPTAVIQAWRNMIAFCLADIAHRPYVPESNLLRDPDFEIIEEIKPRFSTRILATFKWILHSVNPKPPKGLRHRPMPTIVLECKDSRNTMNLV